MALKPLIHRLWSMDYSIEVFVDQEHDDDDDDDCEDDEDDKDWLQ